MTEVSEQWQKLTEEQFKRVDDTFLRDFRAPGTKNKFVAWDPFEPSSRYFKFLLLNTAGRQSARFLDSYRRLAGRDTGHPLTVRFGGCDIDADYLAAVEEWEFLEEAKALDGADTVVEIGAGFGRTCHTLLTLNDRIREYVIVDLPAMLQLSQAYLAKVRPSANIRFISNEDHAQLDALAPDLVINIDSFQEMPTSVIDHYVKRVVGRSSRFYTKNPIGKYLPGTIGQPDLPPERLMDVFKLGYCQDVIDIFDEGALVNARREFLRRYQPPGWPLRADKPMDLFSYFHHAFYAR